MKNLYKYRDLISDPNNREVLISFLNEYSHFSDEVRASTLLPSLRDLDKEIKKTNKNFRYIYTHYIEKIKKNELHKLVSRINIEISSLTKIEAFSPPLRSNHDGTTTGFMLFNGDEIEVIIFSLDKFNLKAHKLKKGVKGISIHPTDSVILCLKGSGKYKKYTLNEKFNDEVGAPEKFEGKVIEREYKTGEVIEINKGKDGLTFSNCNTSSLFMSITNKKKTMLVKPQYCVKTNEILGVVHADNNTSRIQVASIILRMLKFKNTTKILPPLLDSENLYIRWQAAREIFLINKEEAEEIFKEFLNDPSPQIRDAATKCLSEFYGDDYAYKN